MKPPRPATEWTTGLPYGFRRQQGGRRCGRVTGTGSFCRGVRPNENKDQELIVLRTSDDNTSELCPKGVKLRPRGSSRVSQFLIPSYPFQYVRGQSPHRGTAPAGTEGKASGTAVASVGRAA